jgi:hypothetical protein
VYVIGKSVKADPVRRWSLPDRVFFAAGACHILTYAFMERYPDAGFNPIWIKPAKGYCGNHIVAARDDLAIDYHGYSHWPALQAHMRTKAGRWWPGWSCTLVELPLDVLVSERKSRSYDGLWLREPGQYLHDALPRARCFLARFPEPWDSTAAP